MGTVFAFVGIFLVSLLVAVMAALQLADFFNVNQEFILVLVLMLLPVFAVVSLTAFAIAYAAGRTRAIAWTP